MRRSLLMCLIVLPVAALGACAPALSPGTAESASPSARPAAAVLPGLDPLLPNLLEAAGEGSPLRISDAKEESCLDLTHDDNWNTLTRTMASVDGRYADHPSAQGSMDALKAYLQEDGWALDDEVRNEENNNGVVYEVSFHKDELSLTARYDHAARDGRRFVELVITSPCVENPDDHQMIRSSLDPEYGSFSQHYDHNAEKADGSGAGSTP